jgi:hypothetical protein
VDPSLLASKHEFKRGVFNDAIELSRELNRRNAPSSSAASRRNIYSCNRPVPVISAPVMAALLTVNRTLAPTSSIHDLRALMQQTGGGGGDGQHLAAKEETSQQGREDRWVDDEGEVEEEEEEEEEGETAFYTPQAADTSDCGSRSDEHHSCSSASSSRGVDSSSASNHMPFGRTRASPRVHHRTHTHPSAAVSAKDSAQVISEETYSSTSSTGSVVMERLLLDRSSAAGLDEFDLPRVESPSSYDSSPDGSGKRGDMGDTSSALLSPLREEIDTAFSLCLNLNPNSSCCHISPPMGRQQTGYDFELDVSTPDDERIEDLQQSAARSAALDAVSPIHVSVELSTCLAEEFLKGPCAAESSRVSGPQHAQFRSTRSLLPHACPLVMVTHWADCSGADDLGAEQRELRTVSGTHSEHSSALPHTLHRVPSYYEINEQRMCASSSCKHEGTMLFSAAPHSTSDTVMNFRESPSRRSNTTSDLASTLTFPHHSRANPSPCSSMEAISRQEHANHTTKSQQSTSANLTGGQMKDCTHSCAMSSSSSWSSNALSAWRGNRAASMVRGDLFLKAEEEEKDEEEVESCNTVSMASGECGHTAGKGQSYLDRESLDSLAAEGASSLRLHIAKTPGNLLMVVQAAPVASLQLTRWSEEEPLNIISSLVCAIQQPPAPTALSLFASTVRTDGGWESAPNSDGSVDVDQSASSSSDSVSHPGVNCHHRRCDNREHEKLDDGTISQSHSQMSRMMPNQTVGERVVDCAATSGSSSMLTDEELLVTGHMAGSGDWSSAIFI